MTLPVGFSYWPEYQVWRCIRQRCSNPRNSGFKYYGARGIKLAPEWLNFENFISDVGRRPSPAYSIDRYPDNDGHYEPGNVRWATREQQQANTRRSRKIPFNGAEVPLAEAARRAGMAETTLSNRLASGWPIEAALSSPVRKRTILSPNQRAKARQLLADRWSQDRIAAKFGVSQTVISEIKNGPRKRRQ